MERMHICPKCRAVFAKQGDGIYQCPSCKTDMISLGYGRDEWYRLSREERDQISGFVIDKEDGGIAELAGIDGDNWDQLSFEEKLEAVRLAKEKRRQQEEAILNRAPDVIVTTVDLHEDYEVLGPVFFQINDAAGGRMLHSYLKKYRAHLNNLKKKNQLTGDRAGDYESLAYVLNVASLALGGGQDRDLAGNNHALFDAAFFIAVEELRIRAVLLGGDAVVGLRQEFNLDTNGFQHFYLQVCGTAVRTKNSKIFRDDVS